MAILRKNARNNPAPAGQASLVPVFHVIGSEKDACGQRGGRPGGHARWLCQTIARSLRITTSALVVFASIIAAGMVYNGARISLSERGQELGSLRVLGFTQREIGWMLLGELGLLAAVSIAAGLGLDE